jgi:hypothetical protein
MKPAIHWRRSWRKTWVASVLPKRNSVTIYGMLRSSIRSAMSYAVPCRNAELLTIAMRSITGCISAASGPSSNGRLTGLAQYLDGKTDWNSALRALATAYQN